MKKFQCNPNQPFEYYLKVPAPDTILVLSFTGKNLDKAEKLMTTLLQDSTTHNNVRIYATLAEIAQKDYDIENEKLYLNQKSDTATVFRKMSKLFKVRESLDSAEQRFVKMNNVKEKFRERNAAIMDKYRPNLYYGGLFFLRKSAR